MSNYILLYLVFVNSLYRPAPLSTDYLGNLSFTLQPELCPDCKSKTLKKIKNAIWRKKTRRWMVKKEVRIGKDEVDIIWLRKSEIKYIINKLTVLTI